MKFARPRLEVVRGFSCSTHEIEINPAHKCKIKIMVFSEVTGFGNYCSLRPETLQMQTTCEVNKGV